MGEGYNKRYVSAGPASGQVILRSLHIPTAALALNTEYTSNDLTVRLDGYVDQAWRVLPIHAGAGAPTVDVRIEEFMQDSADPTAGTWGRNAALGTAVAVRNEVFVHNADDIARRARLVLTPRTAVVDGGIRVEILARPAR